MNKNGLMKHIGFFLTFLFLISNILIAQNSKENIDKKTEYLFDKKMYKKVIFVGENALKEEKDYFNLRYRIAISYYEFKNYRMAIHHLEKALTFNSDDPAALEYLYYAYLFAGRTNDANLLASKFPDYLKEIVNYKRKYISNIYLEGGPSISNNISKNGSLDIDSDTSIFGESDLNANLFYMHLGLKHDLLPQLSIYHGLSNLSISKRKTIRMNNHDTIFDYTVKQLEYYINADYQLSKGLKITPAFHFLKVNADLTNVSYDTLSYKYQYSNSALSLNNYVLSLGITKEYKLFSISAFTTYSNLNNETQWQLGATANYFPFGNLDYYSATTLAMLNVKSKGSNQGANSGTGNRESRLIFDQLFGVKVLQKLWIEGSFTIGNLANYNEKNAFIVYNIADKINFKSGFSLIYTLNSNFELSLRYQFLSRESNYLYYNNSTETTEILTNYQNNTIIGGIKWKL